MNVFTAFELETLKPADRQLAEELTKLGIHFTIDTAWALKMWGVRDRLIRFKNPVTRQSMYAGYDRHGFVIDGPGAGEEIDQASLAETVDYLKDLFDK